MGHRTTLGVLALLSFVVVASVAGPLVSSEAEGQEATVGPANGTDVGSETPTPPVPHDLPGVDEGDERDLEAVQAWLEGRLQERLNESAAHAEAGRFDRARSLLGEDFSRRVQQLSLVNAELGEADGDAVAFERTRDRQLRFIEEFVTFHESMAQYREAKRRGDLSEARRLDLQLRRQANQTVETEAELARSYRSLDNRTRPQYFMAVQAIDRLRINVTSTRDRLHDTLDRTTLTAESDAATASFGNPVFIEGQLWTVGEQPGPVAHETVEFMVGQRVVEARTDFNGSFSLFYHPVEQPPGSRNLTIRYIPGGERFGGYLGSSASLDVVVRADRPSITASVDPTTVQYGERFTVSGEVTVQSFGVQRVPVDISVGETHVGRVSTDSEGSFELVTTLPADVPVGERTVTAELATDGWAISPERATSSVRVAPTESVITASGTRLESGRVDVWGRLVTGSDHPIANGTVELLVDGNRVATAPTDAEGRFDVTIDRPSGDSGARAVTVRYAPDGSNIEPTRAEVQLTEAPPQNSGWLAGLGASRADGGAFGSLQRELDAGLLAGLLLSGAVLVALGGLYVRRRERRTLSMEATGEEDDVAPALETDDGLDPGRLLVRAEERLTAGDADGAVLAAYASLRRPGTIGPSDGLERTHWEFFRACEDDGLAPDEILLLKTLTERSERAAFGPEPLSDDEAVESLSQARQLLGES